MKALKTVHIDQKPQLGLMATTVRPGVGNAAGAAENGGGGSSRSGASATFASGNRIAWRVDDELAADLDGSLTGLGVDLAGIPYNMSEALMALPVFKEHGAETGFQYILGAPTSPATKMNEETLTYLNQGQPYEMKLKKLGNTTLLRGKFYKSFCKLCFHERRLQYMEREQIDTWKHTRPGERILDIDIPLSYGIMDVRFDPYSLNMVEFVWDPTKEAGLYLKINSISTEFTPKKHGGEKGVPFRVQMDTYAVDENEPPKLLHCASCQVKVFKPKGADRKHKTDRDKVDKQTEAEKEKYQPSYECTVLSELPLDQAICNQVKKSEQAQGNMSNASFYSEPRSPATNGYTEPPSPTLNSSVPPTPTPGTAALVAAAASLPPSASSKGMTAETLSGESSAAEVSMWLQANRFAHYSKVFQNFTGTDLLCLSREELIQICGVADGIRLNNALQLRQARPRLTLYINIQSEQVFHALYLSKASCIELIEKLARLFNASPTLIVDVYVQGSNNIHILVTDEVVENMAEGTQYAVEVLKSESSEQYRILLRPLNVPPPPPV